MKIFSFLLIFFSASTLFAQNNLGARLTAMGNNSAAVTDVWSLQGNPSGISSIKEITASINYAKYLFSNEVSNQSFAFVVPFKNNFAGISFQRYGFSAYNENKVGFAYAKKFGDKFTTAINLNYHQLKISNYGSSKGFSVDVGLLFQLNKQLILGAFVANPSQQSFDTSEILAKIPTSLNIGASYLASDKVLIATTISKILKESIDVKVGIDYKIVEFFCLRGGLSANPFKQYVGFGVNYQKFFLDFATIYEANLGYARKFYEDVFF
ncbi:hypothetical protein EZJ43_12195 [Pedobacter changchengzhani]|uniref:PorV/PorQ family protein n=1 Tax=Pedobacter changchengzhani TaxID=2529274 RepID=A0A4V3A005_9SPHI|nr:hypothetical protein [Pedobacter changchengzhani]TDG35773.1 hypothetical protein EZJ43_12195 [Pedobacter changchengzhani]